MKVKSQEDDEEEKVPKRGRPAARGRARGARARKANGSSREEKKKCNQCGKKKITLAIPARNCALCFAGGCSDCSIAIGMQQMKQRTMQYIPLESFNGNTTEQHIVQDYIRPRKISLQDVYNSMLTEMENKKFNYLTSKIHKITIRHTRSETIKKG